MEGREGGAGSLTARLLVPPPEEAFPSRHPCTNALLRSYLPGVLQTLLNLRAPTLGPRPLPAWGA